MHNKLKNVQSLLVKICFIFFNSFLIRFHPQIIASLFAIAIFFVCLIILMLVQTINPEIELIHNQFFF